MRLSLSSLHAALPWLFVLGFTLPATANASQTHWRLDPLASHYRYREVSDDGQVLNRESGSLFGVRLALAGPLKEHWRWQVHLQELRGDIDYDGSTQSGLALATRTGLRQRETGVHLTRCTENCRTRWFGGLHYVERERDIRATSTTLRLHEDYRHWEGILGAEQTLWIDSLKVSAALTRSLRGEVVPDLRALGYGKPRIELPDTWGLITRADWALITTKRVTGNLHLAYLYRDMARSDAVTVARTGGGSAQIHQPANTLHQWQVGFSLRVFY